MVLPDGWTPLQGLASIVSQMIEARRPARPEEGREEPEGAAAGGRTLSPEQAHELVLSMTEHCLGAIPQAISAALRGKAVTGEYRPEGVVHPGFAVAVYPIEFHPAVVAALPGERRKVSDEVVEVRAAG